MSYAHTEKSTDSKENNQQLKAETEELKLVDGRPEMTAQSRLQNIMANSPQVSQLKSIQAMMANSARTNCLPPSRPLVESQQRSEADHQLNSIIDIDAPVQLLRVNNVEIDNQEQINAQGYGPVIGGILGGWIGNNLSNFASWDQARLFASLAYNISTTAEMPAQATIINAYLKTDGSARYLQQVQAGGAGVYEHHQVVLDAIRVGIMRDVEKGVSDMASIGLRYLDVVGTAAEGDFSIEVKDYSLRSLPNDRQVAHFKSQLHDNLRRVVSTPNFRAIYVFAKGVPQWAHNIMVQIFGAYQADFPVLQGDLNTVTAYPLQGEEAGRDQVTFFNQAVS